MFDIKILYNLQSDQIVGWLIPQAHKPWNPPPLSNRFVYKINFRQTFFRVYIFCSLYFDPVIILYVFPNDTA